MVGWHLLIGRPRKGAEPAQIGRGTAPEWPARLCGILRMDITLDMAAQRGGERQSPHGEHIVFGLSPRGCLNNELMVFISPLVQSISKGFGTAKCLWVVTLDMGRPDSERGCSSPLLDVTSF